MRGKTAVAIFHGKQYAEKVQLFQYDYGQVLKMPDINLPATYEVHFGNSVNGTAVPQIGNENGVKIPDEIVESAGDKFAWVFLHEGPDDGETEYVVPLHIKARAKNTGAEPTPVQQDVITTAIAALNSGVETVSGIAEAIPQTINDALAEAKASGEFDGPKGDPGEDGTDGISPSVLVTDIAGGHRVSVTDKDGTETFDVIDGIDGVNPSIQVEDIHGGHRVTLTDKDGPVTVDVIDGIDGVSPIAVVTKNDGTATISITDKNGTTTAQITDGIDGESGVFVGNTEPSNPNVNVWIKPDGEAHDEISDAVEDWLDNHPEATTTVQDGSITKAKLDSSLSATVDDVDALKSAIDNKNTEIYNGYEFVMLLFANGWINSKGVYNPSDTRFLSNVVATDDLIELVNGSSSNIYAVYLSAYTSLSNFTYATAVNISANGSHAIDKTYPYVAIESPVTSTSGLLGILLKKESAINYLSHDVVTNTIKQETNNSIDGVFVIPQSYLEQGSYSTAGVPGNNPVSTKRIRTKYPTYVKSGSTFMFTSGNKCREVYWFFFKDSGELETSGNWVDQVSKTLNESGYLLFAFRYDNNSTSITPSDYDARVIVKTPVSYYGAELSNVDAEINYFHNLINYDYDKIYDLAPTPGVTSASAVGIKREKNVFTLNTTNAPSDVVKIKICGDMMRTMSSGTVEDWNGITLTQGHTYLIKSIPISGLSTAVTPNAISVYKHGSHASIGNSWIDGTVYYREFTYDDGTVNLAYVVASGATYTDYKCLVTLEDITGRENDKFELPSTIVDDYDATISTNSQGVNKGAKLKIVSYNVAKYNNDTEVYLPTEKEINFKKMLCEIAPDILALQEDRAYVTEGNERTSLTTLYNPIFPYEYLETTGLQCTIRSKIPALTHELVKYSTGRWIEIATYEINGKTLLFGSTHPVANYNQTGIDSEESIAARLVQYNELVKWLNGEITLNKVNGGTPVSCPAYDWCVMCGDYNTITATDMTNFKTIATNGGFKIANGDWLGWIETNYKFFDAPMCLDNVMVSDNVIFNSIISHSEMYKDLYSDHVPFEVTVTLQDG